MKPSDQRPQAGGDAYLVVEEARLAHSAEVLDMCKGDVADAVSHGPRNVGGDALALDLDTAVVKLHLDLMGGW
jgi:hypothetical protein